MSGGVSESALNVYLSASTARLDELWTYAQHLREDGFAIVSRWLSTAGIQDVGEAARRDLEDLASADVLIAFTQGPENPHQGRGGRHVELGVAISRQIAVIVVGPLEHVFHELPAIKVAEDWPQARLLLRALATSWGTQAPCP